jgi:hypothetical protein
VKRVLKSGRLLTSGSAATRFGCRSRKGGEERKCGAAVAAFEDARGEQLEKSVGGEARCARGVKQLLE